MARKKVKAVKSKHKFGTDQLFNFAPNSYLERTSRPIYALIFLLPFIIFYELGTIFINTDVLSQTQDRVVAFVWLQDLLQHLGSGGRLAWIAPPLVVVLILTGFQLSSRKQWYIAFGDIWPMAIECILLAVPLIVLSLLLNSPPDASGNAARFSPDAGVQNVAVVQCSAVTGPRPSPPFSEATNNGDAGGSLFADIVTGIGAGIYEELVFRLILICALMLFFQDLLRFNQKNAIIMSILVSAALFSAHHHIVFVNGQLTSGVPFNWTEFAFRTLAGVYFAGLFAIRGFGITAGTHAFYDIIATILNGVFFQP